MGKSRSKILLIGALILLISPQPMYAYVDPGAGSVFLQLLLGGLAGALVLGKLYWRRLKRMFGFGDRRTDPAPQTEHESTRK